MKRSPLQRKAPMKRGTTPLPKATKPMAQRSKKTEEAYKLRRPLVARLLEERPWCEACPIFAAHDGKVTYVRRPSTEINEIVRRGQGGSILDEANLAALCHPCHVRITEYRDGKDVLAALGLWLPGWTRNQPLT